MRPAKGAKKEVHDCVSDGGVNDPRGVGDGYACFEDGT